MNNLIRLCKKNKKREKNLSGDGEEHNAISPDPFDGIERTELDQSEASNFQVARIVLYWVYYMWLLCLHAECIIQ